MQFHAMHYPRAHNTMGVCRRIRVQMSESAYACVFLFSRFLYGFVMQYAHIEKKC